MTSCRCFAVLVCLSCVPVSAAVRTVALSGEQAPGVPSGVLFGSFTQSSATSAAPVINGNGQVAFRAPLQGAGVTSDNDLSVWSEGSGALSLVAREGDQAPGAPSGAIFRQFQEVLFNSAGHVAFRALMPSGSGGVTTTSDVGIWSDRTGSLGLVAREGDPAPGTPSGVNFNFANSSFGSFNESSQLAFEARTQGASTGFGIWSEGSGALSLVALSGTQAPGTPSGANFLAFDAVEMNDAGQIAITASLSSGGGVNSGNNSGIWTDRSGTLSLLVREGQQAPGTPAGARFDDIYQVPFINNSGQIAFAAFIEIIGSGGVVTASNNYGIWTADSGGLRLVIREGDPAPDAPGGAIIGGDAFLGRPHLNNAGQLAFTGQLRPGSGGVTTNNDEVVWFEDNGLLSLVVREGEQAPGTKVGAVFDRFDSVDINEAGHIALTGFLKRSAGIANSKNAYGIWAQDPSGELELIVREGEFLDVAPGDKRRIENIDILLDDEAFNDLGQLAFRADFTDGTSGIFVAQGRASYIPEPGTLTLVTCCLVAFGSRRHRQ